MLNWLLPLLLGAGGLGTLLFVALRFQREEAGAMLNQHAQVLADTRTLKDDYAVALDRCRAERTAKELEVARLRAELAAVLDEQHRLEGELRRYRRLIDGPG